MRIEQLTFTRFIAAILVIFFHHYRYFSIFNYTNVFVSYFYILSGFVLIYSLKKPFETPKDYLQFYVNRLARIFPLFIFGTVLALLFPPVERNVQPFEIFLNCLGIQAFFPGHVLTLNFPGWSISVELFFYVIFPFLVQFFFQRKSTKFLVGAIVGIWAVSQVAYSWFYHSPFFSPAPSASFDFLYYFPLNHANQFLFGMLIGRVVKLNWHKWQRNYDWYLLLLVAVLFFYLAYLKESVDIFDHNGLLIILFGPIILLLSLNTGFITRVFKWRPLIVAGEISYGVYILAEPLFKMFRAISISTNIPKVSYFHYSLLELCFISYIVFHTIEKPLQKCIREKARDLFRSDRENVTSRATTENYET